MHKSALIIVDVQNDFLPGGSLAVPQGDEVIPRINELMKLPFDVIVATRDFHPQSHSSFASTWGKNPGERVFIDEAEQILWPNHCVQNTKGSELAKDLDTSLVHKIVFKGMNKKVDSYSTFFDNMRKESTGLETYLRDRDIQDLYFTGLATDYCVLYSVHDAMDLGFNAFVVIDACRGVNLRPHDVEKASTEMLDKGAVLLSTQEVKKKYAHV